MTMGLSNSKAEAELVDKFTPRKVSALRAEDAKGCSKKRESGSSLGITRRSAKSLLLEASLMHGISPADMEDEHRSRGTISTKGSPDTSLGGAERAPGNRNTSATHHALLGWLHRSTKFPPGDSSSNPPHHIHVIPAATDSATTTMHKTAPSATTRKSSSANTTPTRSSKLPIPRKSNSVYNDSNRTSYDDDDVEHLKRLYQARTWEMYFRITEARKRSSLNDLNNAPGGATATTAATSNQFQPFQPRVQQHPHPNHPSAFFIPSAVAVASNHDNDKNTPSGYGFYDHGGQVALAAFHHHEHHHEGDSEHELFLGDLDC